jgi:ligand-binding sensor domain-containing protein
LHLLSSTTTVIPDLVLNIFFDKSGQTWLATDGGGLYIYRGKKQVERITFQSIGNDEINLNSVRAFWEDDQEILWLGTYQGGVCYTELNPVKKFDQFNQDPYNINSLSYSAVSAIYVDSEGIFG